MRVSGLVGFQIADKRAYIPGVFCDRVGFALLFVLVPQIPWQVANELIGQSLKFLL